ncbi:MAG: tetratricopeptide repeat protein [Candidatus Hydrogenedentes bacterium]|nr:tetratricopeptide repeat protein [Candidatus Hydrogenedentota bacterium]
MHSISKWAVLMSLAVLLVAAGCGTTGGSSTQTIIHDTHARMVKLDKELGASVSQLNESSATLNARIDASDEQTRAVRGLLEENQVKLDALSRELADMKTTLYRHWNLSTSGSPRNVSTGAVTIESPQGVQAPAPELVQTPVAQTPVPAPVPTGPNVLEDSAPLPTESASPAPEVQAAPTSEYTTEPVAAAPAAVDPKLLYQQAQRSYANDDYAGALSQFDSYLAQYPNNDPDLSANAQFWKAKCLFNMNRYDESVKSFDALRTSYPTSTKVPFAMHNQAVAHSRLGQTAEAERLMEGVIEQYPVSPAADQARADLRKLRGE